MKCKLRAPYGALSFFVKEVKKVPYIHFTEEQKLRASETDLPDDHEEPVSSSDDRRSRRAPKVSHRGAASCAKGLSRV